MERVMQCTFNAAAPGSLQGGLNEHAVDLLVEAEKYERFGGGKTRVVNGEQMEADRAYAAGPPPLLHF